MDPRQEKRHGGNNNPFGDALFSYTRAQAIADGVLVDVSGTAREAGIRFPVAMTAAVWNRFVELPAGLEGIQDRDGRLWDILWMFRTAAKREGGQLLRFQLLVQNDAKGPKEVTLKAVCGPGDEAEPVVTIMLPDED